MYIPTPLSVPAALWDWRPSFFIARVCFKPSRLFYNHYFFVICNFVASEGVDTQPINSLHGGIGDGKKETSVWFLQPVVYRKLEKYFRL